jgi:hypothetical protein
MKRNQLNKKFLALSLLQGNQFADFFHQVIQLPLALFIFCF